jgi:hypothetical protein
LKRFKFLLKLKLLGLEGEIWRLLAGDILKFSGPSNPETSLGWIEYFGVSQWL